jgi:hypothetical protein
LGAKNKEWDCKDRRYVPLRTLQEGGLMLRHILAAILVVLTLCSFYSVVPCDPVIFCVSLFLAGWLVGKIANALEG